MKKCINCQTELSDDSVFCSECGSKQPVEESNQEFEPNAEAVITPVEKNPGKDVVAEQATALLNASNKALSSIDVSKWDKIGLIGIVLMGIAVLLPIVNASFVSTLTSLINVSQLLSFVVLVLCCVSAYYLSEKNFNVPCAVGGGIFAVAAYMCYKIHSTLAQLSAEMDKSAQGLSFLFGGGMAKGIQKMLSDMGIGIGLYFLLTGAVIVMLSCGASRLIRRNENVEIGAIITEVKNMMSETVDIGSMRLPTFALTIVVIAIIAFIGTTLNVQAPM